MQSFNPSIEIHHVMFVSVRYLQGTSHIGPVWYGGQQASGGRVAHHSSSQIKSTKFRIVRQDIESNNGRDQTSHACK